MGGSSSIERVAAMADRNQQIELLQRVLEKLQTQYQLVSELSEADFIHSSQGPPPADPEMEKVARIAEQFGYDGNIFRNLLSSSHISDGLRKTHRQIATLPKLLAKLDEPVQARYLGSGRIEIDDMVIRTTNPTMTKVLELLVDNRSVSKEDVEQIVGNAAREIGKLIALDNGALETYIHRPKSRNQGYRTSIIDGRE